MSTEILTPRIADIRLHHLGPKDTEEIYEILADLLHAFRSAGVPELEITTFLMSIVVCDHNDLVRMVFDHVDFDTSDE